MPDFDSILAQAAQLPLGDRMQLIEALWETLPEYALPPLSREWQAEISRRSANFDAGGVETVSWASVKEDAARRLSAGDR